MVKDWACSVASVHTGPSYVDPQFTNVPAN
jgi:hypothetical protein